MIKNEEKSNLLIKRKRDDEQSQVEKSKKRKRSKEKKNHSTKNPQVHSEIGKLPQTLAAPHVSESVSGTGNNWDNLKSRLMKTQGAVSGVPGVKSYQSLSTSPLVSPATKTVDGIDSMAKFDAATLENARATVTGPFSDASPLSGEHKRYLALDCEMVGVGPHGMRSSLAQVVVVDWNGRVLLNKYVKSGETVVDYRTAVSGITPRLLRDADSFASVQKEVATMIEGKTIVGHGLENDLKALLLSHPSSRIRDTARYVPFCWRGRDGSVNPQKLKNLVHQHLSLGIQMPGVSHEPAEDARGALALYKLHRRQWEHGLLKNAKATTAPKGNKATQRKKKNKLKKSTLSAPRFRDAHKK